ncbi:MAG: hypothetical protein R3B36_24685 [Polyangiaceae bacterium]
MKTRLTLAAILVLSTAGGGAMIACSSSDAGEDLQPFDAGVRDTAPEPTKDSGGTVKPDTGAPPPVDAGGDASDAGACLGDTDAGLDCNQAGACGDICRSYLGDYKSGPAKATVDCLLKDTTQCDNGMTLACADKAVGQACADPTATTFCQGLVTRCTNANPGGRPLTQADCEKLARALTPAGRGHFTDCIENGNVGACRFDPFECVEFLK